MANAPRMNAGTITALAVVGFGVLMASSHPTVRGAGATATINGKAYRLHGAYETKARAQQAAARLRRTYRERKYSRVSIRVVRRRFRGVSQLWLVYTRARFNG